MSSKTLDILSSPVVEITDNLILRDKRVTILYLYQKLSVEYSNVELRDNRLHIDGAVCVLRSLGKSVNFYPSYQKGYGRHQSHAGFSAIQSNIDLVILCQVVGNTVKLIPKFTSDLTNPIMTEVELCAA